MEEITSEQKQVFSRVANFSKETSLVYNNNKIIFNGKSYIRNLDNEWKLEPLQDEDIGYVTYEKYKSEITVLKNKIEELQRDRVNEKKPRYRSLDNHNKVKVYVRKVMTDIKRMRMLQPNENLDREISREVNWEGNPEERKEILKDFYEASKNKKYQKSKIYSYYKRLSVLNSLYEVNFPTSNNVYSKFYLDIKDVTGKSYSEVTKFVKKIEIFTKLFNLLPAGAWAICEIPLTYWLLIYRECWEKILDCVENEKKFPFEDFFNNEELISKFKNLEVDVEEEELDDEDDDYEEVEKENEE